MKPDQWSYTCQVTSKNRKSSYHNREHIVGLRLLGEQLLERHVDVVELEC